MAEEKDLPKYTWVLPRDGVTHEVYGNYAHPSWTLFDVRIRVGQLVPDEESKGFVVEERAAVTFSWAQAKILRDMLTGLVDSYEEVNGEIKRLILPPAKTEPPKEG